MTEYLFRVLPGNMQYELSKWDDEYSSQLPKEVYRINNWHCSCPAHVPHCKHLAMLKVAKDANMDLNGLVWDDKTNIWGRFIGVRCGTM